jgi:signal transduction histidine kinase
VTDHGPGVPDHLKSRIFDSFYQGRSMGDQTTGTGLGLAISRGVAEAHGGSIEVRNTPGGGASFVLSLPASLADQRVGA